MSQVDLHTIQLNHNGKTHLFHLPANKMALMVAQQVLSGSSYPIMPMQGEVKTIVDIGANIGAAAVYFSLHYPGAKILAFEPGPASFELLKQNTADLHNVAAFPYGLSDHPATQALFLGREDSVSNSLLKSPLNSAQSVPVELRAADQVLRELNIDVIDILKLDTEGSEVPILSKMADWIPKVGCLYLEYHHADDRIALEQMLAKTHWLCIGKIHSPHRGEFIYLSRARMPSIEKWEADKIQALRSDELQG